MILTSHGEHLSDAFVDLRERLSEITVIASNGFQVSLNQNLLKLFSPFLREILGSIPPDCAPVLIIPESSILTFDQFSKILCSGVTCAGTNSYKEVNDIVELGKLFGLDLSRISYEQKKRLELSSIYPSNAPKKNAVEPQIILVETVTVEDLQSKQHASPTVVKNEIPEDILFNFSDVTKVVKEKNRGVESNTIQKIISPDKIKQEIIEDGDEIPTLFDVDSEKNFHDFEYFQNCLPTSDQIQEKPVNVFIGPMHMPIQKPKAPAINNFSNTFATPPPGYYPNIVPSLAHSSRIFESEQQQPPRKKIKKAFSCDYCKYTTYTKKANHKHMMDYHSVSRPQLGPSPSTSSDGGVYSCKTCEYVGPHEHALRQHVSGKHGKQRSDKSARNSHSQPDLITSLRKANGWVHDDRYTCDYWNFHICQYENGHNTAACKVIRYHVCSLCFRNTGEKKSHPAIRCRFFPLPETYQQVAASLTGLTPPNITREVGRISPGGDTGDVGPD